MSAKSPLLPAPWPLRLLWKGGLIWKGVWNGRRGAGAFRLALAGLVGLGALGGLAPPQALAQEKDYREWLRQQRREYKQFLSEQDKAFLKFLKKKWASVDVDTAASSPIDNKPRQIPRVDDVPPSPSEKPPETDPPQDETPQPPPPSPDPTAPEEDSAANSKRLRNRQTGESDSSFQTNESQMPDDMEEAMDDLKTTEDKQKSSPSENPSSKNPPPKNPPQEKSSPEKPQTEKPQTEKPPSENPSSAGRSETATLSREASLSFFGASTTVPYGTASVPQLQGTPDRSTIRRFWKTMAKGPYRPTLDVLQKQREELGLSDWGYYLYLKDLGGQLYGDDASNERVLWTWFMMMKSGYAARVGYRGNEVFLMLPVADKIFGRPQMHIGGQRYYLMVESMNGSLRTYKGRHEGASQVLQLDEGSLPDVASSRKTETVEFSFRDQRHSLEVAYNPATVEYLRAYPNVGLQVLLGAGVSKEARSSFEAAFGPLLKNRPPRESLNLLLKFAQFATDYKRDQDHFGEERYLFPEESLATGYSDCEDRAVLLAYLTRTLLDREVVGLQWPTHVALAVRAGDGLTATKNDHTVTVDGKTYIYADPTYIGSTLGMKMPLVEGQAPEIITLDK